MRTLHKSPNPILTVLFSSISCSSTSIFLLPVLVMGDADRSNERRGSLNSVFHISPYLDYSSQAAQQACAAAEQGARAGMGWCSARPRSFAQGQRLQAFIRETCEGDHLAGVTNKTAGSPGKREAIYSSRLLLVG